MPRKCVRRSDWLSFTRSAFFPPRSITKKLIVPAATIVGRLPLRQASSPASTAFPSMRASASAASFTAGAALPLLMVFLDTGSSLPWTVSGASLLFLAILGALGAWAGNAPMLRPVLRVTFWGAFAMALTIAIGSLFEAPLG